MPKRSLTEEVRRAQIVEATTEVLAKYGSINTSFTRITKQAGLSSPGLISYHFKNKEELLHEVLESIMRKRMTHMYTAIEAASTATDKLQAALEADFRYMADQPELFAAIVEVFYSLRNPEGLMAYMDDNDGEPLKVVVDILRLGQKNGEFGRFDAYNLALIIDGARTQFLAQQLRRPSFNPELFCETLLAFALQSVKNQGAK